MVEIVEIGTFVMVIVKVTTQGTAERIFARRTSIDPLVTAGEEGRVQLPKLRSVCWVVFQEFILRIPSLFVRFVLLRYLINPY